MPRIHPGHAWFVSGLCVLATIPTSGVAAQPQTITLEKAIAASLTSPALLAARETIEQARADAQTAGLLPNPTLGVEAGMLPLSRRYTVDEPGGPSELAIGLTLPIDTFVFGKRRAAIHSAEMAIRIAEAEFADQIRQRMAGTTLAFLSVLEAQAAGDLATQATRDLEQFESAMQRATAGGGRPVIEWQRVQLELRGARREARTARLQTLTAKAELSTWLGKGDALDTWEIAGDWEAPGDSQPLPMEEGYRIAAGARPDLQALAWKVEQASRIEIVEDRNAWPETSVGLGVAKQFQHAIGAPDVIAWGATLEIGLPFFDRNQGNRRKAVSATTQAKLALSAARTALRAEVENATRAWALALENAAEIAHTDLELAARVRDGMRKSHELGGRTLLEVLDAQRGYRETYKAFLASRADCARAQAIYETTLGKRITP